MKVSKYLDVGHPELTFAMTFINFIGRTSEWHEEPYLIMKKCWEYFQSLPFKMNITFHSKKNDVSVRHHDRHFPLHNNFASLAAISVVIKISQELRPRAIPRCHSYNTTAAEESLVVAKSRKEERCTCEETSSLEKTRKERRDTFSNRAETNKKNHSQKRLRYQEAKEKIEKSSRTSEIEGGNNSRKQTSDESVNQNPIKQGSRTQAADTKFDRQKSIPEQKTCSNEGKNKKPSEDKAFWHDEKEEKITNAESSTSPQATSETLCHKEEDSSRKRMSDGNVNQKRSEKEEKITNAESSTSPQATSETLCHKEEDSSRKRMSDGNVNQKQTSEKKPRRGSNSNTTSTKNTNSGWQNRKRMSDGNVNQKQTSKKKPRRGSNSNTTSTGNTKSDSQKPNHEQKNPAMVCTYRNEFFSLPCKAVEFVTQTHLFMLFVRILFKYLQYREPNEFERLRRLILQGNVSFLIEAAEAAGNPPQQEGRLLNNNANELQNQPQVVANENAEARALPNADLDEATNRGGGAADVVNRVPAVLPCRNQDHHERNREQAFTSPPTMGYVAQFLFAHDQLQASLSSHHWQSSILYYRLFLQKRQRERLAACPIPVVVDEDE